MNLELLLLLLIPSVQIGFTSFDKWLTFSPAKNDLESAAAAAADGVPPGTASSAESEFYAQAARRLQVVSGVWCCWRWDWWVVAVVGARRVVR